MPALVRTAAYQALALAGALLCGPSNSRNVQRLPFEIYLKKKRNTWHTGLANEHAALETVRARSVLPVPAPLDLVRGRRWSYLVTARLPRRHVGAHMDLLSDEELDRLAREDGALLGVVDWENAGWYPDYWDCTKARYVTKLQKRWLAAVDRVFSELGGFSEELATEFKLWHYCF